MLGEMPRWRLFKVGGHEVFLEPLFLLLIAFFVFSGLQSASQFATNLLWAPILFIGVLWHEFGHAIAIKKYGYGPSTIILQGLGGVTINQNRGNSPPGKSIVISLAGPAFSLSLTVIFGLAAFFYPGDDLIGTFFTLMAWVNGVWAVFNLLPINPMDGGHVVLHALRAKFPARKALRYSAISSLVVLAILAVPLLYFFDPFLTIILMLLFGMQNVQVLKQVR